jgi:hypothetical protein
MLIVLYLARYINIIDKEVVNINGLPVSIKKRHMKKKNVLYVITSAFQY